MRSNRGAKSRIHLHSHVSFGKWFFLLVSCIIAIIAASSYITNYSQRSRAILDEGDGGESLNSSEENNAPENLNTGNAPPPGGFPGGLPPGGQSNYPPPAGGLPGGLPPGGLPPPLNDESSDQDIKSDENSEKETADKAEEIQDQSEQTEESIQLTEAITNIEQTLSKILDQL